MSILLDILAGIGALFVVSALIFTLLIVTGMRRDDSSPRRVMRDIDAEYADLVERGGAR